MLRCAALHRAAPRAGLAADKLSNPQTGSSFAASFSLECSRFSRIAALPLSYQRFGDSAAVGPLSSTLSGSNTWPAGTSLSSVSSIGSRFCSNHSSTGTQWRTCSRSFTLTLSMNRTSTLAETLPASTQKENMSSRWAAMFPRQPFPFQLGPWRGLSSAQACSGL